MTLRHEFTQRAGNAFSWRVSVEGADELALRVHDVKVGTMVHDVVVGASPVTHVVSTVFLGSS